MIEIEQLDQLESLIKTLHKTEGAILEIQEGVQTAIEITEKLCEDIWRIRMLPGSMGSNDETLTAMIQQVCALHARCQQLLTVLRG